MSDDLVSVRYLVDDVEASIAFSQRALRFHGALQLSPGVRRRRPRPSASLLRGGPRAPPAGRCPTDASPTPGGWNRIQLIVEDIAAEVDRLARRGV